MPAYQLFGYRVECNIDLGHQHTIKSSEIDLSILAEQRSSSVPGDGALSLNERFYDLDYHDDHQNVSTEGLVLDIRDERIACRYDPGSIDPDLLRIELLGTALPLWLERRGITVVHGAAVERHGQAVVLLGAGGQGKSTLASQFLQTGWRLLADDLSAIDMASGHAILRPAYPAVRLWPGSAADLKNREKEFPMVHKSVSKLLVPVGPAGIGEFCADLTPLAAIYLLRRDVSANRTEIVGRSGIEAMTELLRNSFVGQLLEDTTARPERLQRVGSISREVPVRQVTYCSDLELIPEVCDRICIDLDEVTG